MNNILVLPMVIPLLTGDFTYFSYVHYVKVQRVLVLLAIIATVAVSIYILNLIQTEGILRLDFGGWLPPYGILFVADSFSMLLVLTTVNCIQQFILLYAFSSIGAAHENMFFYPFVFFLNCGCKWLIFNG